jgi:hypothetical protein
MDADNLIAAIERQADLYARLEILAEQQHECVVQDRQDELLDVLQRRQDVIDRIVAGDKLIKLVRTHWADVTRMLPEASRLRAERAMTAMRDHLARVVQCDADDALVLQQRKFDVGRQLGQTQSRRAAHSGYAASAYVGAASTDTSR